VNAFGSFGVGVHVVGHGSLFGDEATGGVGCALVPHHGKFFVEVPRAVAAFAVAALCGVGAAAAFAVFPARLGAVLFGFLFGG